MDFLIKKCKICKKLRKFLKDSPRDKLSICGECWDWGNKDKTFK